MSPKKNKIKLGSNGEDKLLQFISEVKAGKYTKDKPNLSQITYKRLQIQEQETSLFTDNVTEESFLFGIL